MLPDPAQLAAAARERITNLLGPDPVSNDAREAYYRELAAWTDWHLWVNPDPPPQQVPDWRRT